jgi:hypothetical protein
VAPVPEESLKLR